MNDLIKEFVEQGTIDSLQEMIDSTEEKVVLAKAVEVASIFNAQNDFEKLAQKDQDVESKLVSDFHKNLELLIQKTWVEKSDEELKAEVLYHLEEFCKKLNAKSYTASYGPFFNIVNDVVYLMFGNQTKTEDFDEYALRIDPEFGIFWWYISSLPKDILWNESKSRIAIMLGMYFLANY